MPNITLSVDARTVRKVRKIAVDRDTTLTAMVREYLESVAATAEDERTQQVEDLRRSFASLSRRLGPRNWTREDLHDR